MAPSVAKQGEGKCGGKHHRLSQTKTAASNAAISALEYSREALAALLLSALLFRSLLCLSFFCHILDFINELCEFKKS